MFCLIHNQLKGDKEADIFSLALRMGKLEARFRSGEMLSITSRDTFNDGVFHSVVVLITGRK